MNGVGPRPPRPGHWLRRAASIGCLWALAATVAVPAPAPQEAPAAPSAVPAYRQADVVGVLTIRGPIDRVTLRSLERRLREALDEGAEAIVLDLDTPGGALEATLDICHLVKTDAPPNTVAWINPKAYSAGTIIALACREIVVAPNASFGDAAPISALGPLPPTERAKLESPLLAEVVNSARRNHYDEKLVQSFVAVGVELWMLEHTGTGERVFVDKPEYRAVFGEDPPDELTPLAPPDASAAPPVRPWFEPLVPIDESMGGKPPDPESIKRQIEAEQDLPSARPRLTREDRDEWRPVKQVVSNDVLLVVKPEQALEYGLATRVIADDQQLAAYFGAQSVKRYDRSWSESLVQFLTGPIVRGVLIVIFLICTFVEMASPGLGVFGTAAIVSLLIVIGAPWLAGMAQWWEILLILAGLVLVAVELFIVPGFGVAGIGGLACLLVGFVGTFVSGDLRTPAGQSQLLTGLGATFASMLAAGVGFWFVFRQLETLPLLGRLVLKAEIVEAPQPTGLLEAAGQPEAPVAEGDVGVAETDLRPAGRATIKGRLLDVKSASRYIDAGTRVRVVTVDEFVVEVEEA